MKLLLASTLLMICVGIGYCIRITDFLDPFFSLEHNDRDRQSTTDINSQIVPLFAFTFVASVVGNLIGTLLLNFINGGTDTEGMLINKSIDLQGVRIFSVAKQISQTINKTLKQLKINRFTLPLYLQHH